MSDNHDQLDFSELPKVEAVNALARTEKTLERQAHIVKAAEAYCRLTKNRDFKLVLEHLHNTSAQLALDLCKRSPEAQSSDVQVIRAISTVCSLLEDMPALVGHVTERMDDTKRTLEALRKVV